MNEREKVVERLCRGWCKVCGGRVEREALDISTFLRGHEDMCLRCLVKMMEEFFNTQNVRPRRAIKKEK